MSRTVKIIELWLFHQFDKLVYIGTVLVTLGWVYAVACQFQYRYEQKKIPVTWNVSIEQTVNVPHAEFGMKYILKWVKPQQHLPFWDEGQSIFFKHRCKINDCYLTSNRNMLRSVADFDAIVFHGPSLIFQYTQTPNARSSRQKYVFLSVEHTTYPICDYRFDGFFNWTWTYQFDSDYAYGYLRIRDKEGKVIGPNKTMHWINAISMKTIDDELKRKLNNKAKAAACIVSDCQNLDRETFVKKLQFELKQYELEVDIYRRCDGGMNCDLKNMSCLQMIEKKYYFYLALENPSSENIVTEKLLLALQNYAVPIVLGVANYTRFMPDGIYLDGRKLNPKALAKEMVDIINDKERYYSFFKWHNHYSYHAREESPDTDGLCKLCEMLHDEELMSKKTVYKDFRKWWNVPGDCQSQEDTPIS